MSVLPKEAKILSVADGVRFLRFGGTQSTRVVTYTLGDHGPFRFELPVEQFSAELVNQEITRRARELRDLGALEPEGA